MICSANTVLGAGGVAGGAGAAGSVAQYNTPTGTSMGTPIIKTMTGVPTTLSVNLSDDIYGEIPHNIPDGYTVDFIVKPSKDSSTVLLDIPASYDGNQVSVTITEDDFPKSGLYPASFVVKDPDGKVYSEHPSYVCVDQGLNYNSDPGEDPVTIADVRMALLDYSPEYNTLLDDLEFSDLQIIAAIKRPVNEWNETPPDIRRYTYSNFPWREFWLKGTCSYLLEMAAHRYNRNTMPHNASGLTMDPMNKGGAYMQAAMMLRQEWKAFIVAKKTELNMADCWGVTYLDTYNGSGSSYGYL